MVQKYGILSLILNTFFDYVASYQDGVIVVMMMTVIIIIIIILLNGYIDIFDIFINCNWVVTLWQYTFTHKQYIEQHK